MKYNLLYKLKQLPFIDKSNKLEERDFMKISKKLPKEPFGSECVLWQGVLVNKDNVKKGQYINFYFNKKKTTLHRLLYQNYVNANLNNTTYLIHTCNNKSCCNIDHLQEKRKDTIKDDKLFKIDFQISF